MSVPRSKVSLIVAMSENRVIGRAGGLPWHLPDDLKHFKRLTLERTVIMGRKTFESIGRPLPQRRNVVITRNRGWSAEGVEVAHSLPEALARTAWGDEIFVIGGEQVYRDALPLADRIYLTLVHAAVEGDAYFPRFDQSQWRVTQSINHLADDRHAHAFTFLLYERQGAGPEQTAP
jgi:dihydrofolate reductase